MSLVIGQQDRCFLYANEETCCSDNAGCIGSHAWNNVGELADEVPLAICRSVAIERHIASELVDSAIGSAVITSSVRT